MKKLIARLGPDDAYKVEAFLAGDPDTKVESPDLLIEMLCRLQGMVFHSPAMPRYPSNPSDCFCPDKVGRLVEKDLWENDGEAVRYIMRATLAALTEAEARFEACVVEFCNQEMIARGTISDPETGTLIEVGFCTDHFTDLIGDSTKGLSLG